jgi:hypothetical protein
MKVLTIYRMLLRLYPSSFRREFGREMLEVFRGLVENRTTVTTPAFALLMTREFTGLLSGAAGAWIKVLLPKKIYFVVPIPILSQYLARPSAEEAALTTPELEERLKVTKDSMFQAVAHHDRVTARSFASRAARLELLLKNRAR